MALEISVAPVGDGWAVRSEALEQDLAFSKGGRAEAWAHTLAEQLAQTGRPAEVRIFLRDGELAGAFLHHVQAA